MKIGIDISQIVYDTGVSWYTYNLVKNLLRIDNKNDYILYAGVLRRKEDLRQKIKNFSGNFQVKILPIPPVIADILWNRFHILSMNRFIDSVDIFHSSDWTQPPTNAFKVTTIHDLSPFVYPETVEKDLIRNVAKTQRNRHYWIRKEVDKVIAVSKATKRDIVKYLGIPADKIVVIYEAPDPIYRKRTEPEIQKVRQKYDIKGDYFLTIGAGKRKNLDKIYQAYFASFSKNYTLVVACHGELNTQPGMLHVKDPSSYELSCLYSGADALIYASLYEGFGLPILEAFVCGCPVVTSDVSSMPEVAGGAAVLVDPASVESIEEGIKEALGSRDILIKKGEDRVKSFSWEKTAAETLNLYQSLVKD